MRLSTKKQKFPGDFPVGSEDKASACNAGDPGLIPGLGRSPGEGNGNPLQYSCLENPMDRGAWRATVHGVTKSWTQLSNFTHTYFPTATMAAKFSNSFKMLRENSCQLEFCTAAAAAAGTSLQSCPTLCDPIDGSSPGSPVPGILQARHWSRLPCPSPMYESEKWK